MFMKKVKKYLMNLLILLDLGLNTVLLGDPQETLSSRLGKAASEGNRLAYYACRCLAWFDKAHCRGSVDKDEGDRAIWRW